MSSEDVATFGAADYAVFGVMLGISAGIGIYFAYKDRQGKEGVKGYLIAARQMNFIPVAISLSLSFISAVTVLGIPAEIYFFGSMYMWLFGAILWVVPVVSEIFIPAFYRLGITSAFEYLEMRFNRYVRLMSTFIYVIQNIMYIGIMIYAPALALSSVTNFNLWAAVATIGVVCTFYTTLGGLKAVIWTDVFQGIVLIVGMIVTLAVSSSSVGGFGAAWEACERGGRVDFVNFQFDPRYRNTAWSMTVGLGFLWLTVFGTSQSQVQRYLSCKSEWEAKKGLYLGIATAVVCLLVSMLTGFTAYAYFEDCDPLTSGRISEPDQILPYMILRIFNNQPGMPGLFVAGLFAGCLSTVSSGINAMACVTVKDFIQPFVSWSSRVMTWVSKGMVFLFGILCIGFAILASNLGGVLEASLSVLGLIGGPILSVFSLGFIFPCANSLGAGVGLISGIALSSWIYIGSTIYGVPQEFLQRKPLNISGCNITLPASNVTVNATIVDRPPVADLYAVSYAYYAAIGFGATLIVGLLVSLPSGGYRNRKNVDPRLVLPLLDHKIFRWLPSKFRRWMWCGVPHDTVDKNVMSPGDSTQYNSTEMPTVDGSLKKRHSSDSPPDYNHYQTVSEEKSSENVRPVQPTENPYLNEAFEPENSTQL